MAHFFSRASMRRSAGTCVKSSLSHTFLHDTRDDKNHCYERKNFQELASFGMGGDIRFYRVEIEGQVSKKMQKKTGAVRLASCLAFQILTFCSQCHWQQGRAFCGVLHQEEGPCSQTNFCFL